MEAASPEWCVPQWVPRSKRNDSVVPLRRWDPGHRGSQHHKQPTSLKGAEWQGLGQWCYRCDHNAGKMRGSSPIPRHRGNLLDRSYGGVNENQLPLDSYCLCGFAVIRLDLGVLVVSRASSWEKQAGCRVETEDKLSSRKLCYLSYGNNLLRNWLPLHFFLLNVLQIPLLLNSNQEPYREEDLGKHSFQASIHSLHILPLKDSQIYIA